MAATRYIAPNPMRFFLFLLTALCLSALSFSAAANVRAAVPQVESAKVAGAAVVAETAPDYDAMLATGEELTQLVLPGDADFGADDEFDDGPPPGYCNIWSADLLDPPDLFDAVDETSAFFVLPEFQLAQSIDTVVPMPTARGKFHSDGLFRPPRRLA
ncbi:auxiliary protein of the heavy metal cation-transporting efflux system HmyCBA [Cupriavidus sp. BIS7]|uniref:auxiliary protein of the heavy metal cation-transporting efflux system HmyCBA n=1 Tax=Cupriavidus sp. BIS7 TaxID=1217718 RepID=UPI001ED8DD1A|nr:auxiliary protein of the heavy metal cation-transporting efflux system HmyCBA [Cupriavidus sp. BIS7]